MATITKTQTVYRQVHDSIRAFVAMKSENDMTLIFIIKLGATRNKVTNTRLFVNDAKSIEFDYFLKQAESMGEPVPVENITPNIQNCVQSIINKRIQSIL